MREGRGCLLPVIRRTPSRKPTLGMAGRKEKTSEQAGYKYICSHNMSCNKPIVSGSRSSIS